MDIPNDTTLCFAPGRIARMSKPDCSESEFLRRQVAAIEAYVERFPSDEREFRALAWIEANARQYRHQWQMQVEKSARHHRQSALGC